MIQAIVFDCYGVLALDGCQIINESYLDNSNRPHQRIAELTGQISGGILSHHQQMQELTELTGLSPDTIQYMIGRYLAYQPMFDYIASDLVGNYKLAILSNTTPQALERLFTVEQKAYFDLMMTSSESGVMKPDKLAYEMLAARLDLDPQECIYIDDQPRNVEAANAVGMHALLYVHGVDVLKADIIKITG